MCVRVFFPSAAGPREEKPRGKASRSDEPAYYMRGGNGRYICFYHSTQTRRWDKDAYTVAQGSVDDVVQGSRIARENRVNENFILLTQSAAVYTHTRAHASVYI